MRVGIIGAGYVGLVTGACLAGQGHDVTLVDLDVSKVEKINSGAAPFFEPGLNAKLESVVPDKLTAVTSLSEGIGESDVVMLAIGTPTTNGEIDLTDLCAACEELGRHLKSMESPPVVVIKSTVVPGTTSEVLVPILEMSSGLEIESSLGVAVNPEFLTEGSAVADFESPDRIVIGATDPKASALVERLYSTFDAPIITTNPSTAELIKYASNTLFATLISFSNEIAAVAAQLEGVDIVDVMRGVHTSRYLTPGDGSGKPAEIAAYLAAGTGYGGSCLPKDTQALAARGEALGVPMRILRAVDEINGDQPDRLVDLVRTGLGSIDGRTVGVLGLSFKPGTDDVRQSPAIQIIRTLLTERGTVLAHDPMAIDTFRTVFGSAPGLIYESDLDSVVHRVDALVLVTSWDTYRELPTLIAGVSQPPLLVDGRRFIPKDSVPRYAGIGIR